MLNTTRIVKTSVITTTIISVLCSLVVWIFPVMSGKFITMSMHSRLAVETPVMTLGGVILAIIVWDVIVGLVSWLFCSVYNNTKE